MSLLVSYVHTLPASLAWAVFLLLLSHKSGLINGLISTAVNLDLTGSQCLNVALSDLHGWHLNTGIYRMTYLQIF